MSPPLDKLREICLSMPHATERPSHGEPCWFINDKKLFVMFANRHHDDRVAMWCAAPPGVQEVLVSTEPSKYFRPPYVGHRGWMGVYLDVQVDWEEIRGIMEEAYRFVAGKS
jgi:hypothetical protein